MPQTSKTYKKPAMNDDLMRSFGRVRGRKLGQEQTFLVDEILPKFEINLDKNLGLPEIFDKNITEFCIEIGFGRGEHLAEFAKQNPHIGCIGCEPFINGVARLLKFIHDDKIPNIRILHGDARLLLEKLPDNIISKVFVLFPDPWPKAKHQRKRIISNETLDTLARKIQKGGILEIATDHVEYGDWIAEHLENHPIFQETTITKNQQHIPPADWIRTRYQEKAEKEGRSARFFHFVGSG
jgi:tRNA (guanine-N7-)-methyltransferase